MTEALLHHIWQHQMLSPGLTTTDGQPIVVLKAGELNDDAGPDFTNARVRIGEMEWAGNIEVHIHTSDWKRHHHSTDAAYNNLVLHVVYEHDCEIKLQNGRVPATLELKQFLHPSIIRNYEFLTTPKPDSLFPCASRVGEVPELVLHSFMERLTVERIAAKSETVRRMLAENHGNWEQTCYWLISRYFGGKINALAFELLAKATDPRLLARWRNNSQRTEALLMGQSGLLEGYFEEDYPRALQADYEPLRKASSLTPIDGSLWKFYRLRPSSFPTIRISQLANLISQTGNLFSRLLEITDGKELEALFNQQAAPYWDNHYTFDRETERTTHKRVGVMQADVLIINAWVPLLFVYGTEHGQQRYKDQALSILEQLLAENNNIVRQWKQAGICPRNAADSQALLQLTHAYCSSRQCLHCRIGYHILRKP